jgi:hypothetical protein
MITVLGEKPLSGWLSLLGGAMALPVGRSCFEVCERRFLHA